MIVSRDQLYDIIQRQKFRYCIIEDLHGKRAAKFTDGANGMETAELIENVKDWIENYGSDFIFTFKIFPAAKDDVFVYELKRHEQQSLQGPQNVNIEEIEQRITEKIETARKAKELEEKETKLENWAGQLEYVLSILIKKYLSPQQVAGAMQGVTIETEKETMNATDQEKIEKAIELIVATKGMTADLLLKIATKLYENPSKLNAIKTFL